MTPCYWFPIEFFFSGSRNSENKETLEVEKRGLVLGKWRTREAPTAPQ